MIYFPFITFLFFFINNILCQRNIKIDSELILCSVCNEMIENIIIQINKKKETLPYKKIDEENIQNIISNICINNKVEGEWIRRLDIIHKKSEENNNKLDITKPGGISKCQDECKTITKSCEILFDDFIDPDDLSALLYKNKLSIKETQKKVCSEWANKCNKKQKGLPYPRIDELFKVVTEKDLQMEQLMASMKEQGMGGMSMYNKEDMENMISNGEMPGMDAMGDYDDYYGNLPGEF